MSGCPSTDEPEQQQPRVEDVQQQPAGRGEVLYDFGDGGLSEAEFEQRRREIALGSAAESRQRRLDVENGVFAPRSRAADLPVPEEVPPLPINSDGSMKYTDLIRLAEDLGADVPRHLREPIEEMRRQPRRSFRRRGPDPETYWHRRSEALPANFLPSLRRPW